MIAATNFPTLHQRCFDAVIWDYDGTLVASRFADEEAVERLLEHDPAARAGAEVFWATEGQPLLPRIELAWPGRSREILPLFDEQAAPHRFAHVDTVVAALQARGYHLAVVSSRRRLPLERGLRRTGLRDRFEDVVSLDDVREPKPSPEGLLHALRALGVPPTRAVYVGDSELDIEAGRRAGMTAWRATWSAALGQGTPLAGPHLVSDPRQVLDRVDTMGEATG